MSEFELALYLHLLGVITMLSGILIAGLAHIRARTRQDPGEIALLLGFARSGVVIAGPGTLLTIAAGAWLASQVNIGLGTGWLGSAVGVFVLSLLLGAMGGRRLRHARELAERLREEGTPATPELHALLDDRASMLANLGSAVAMLVVLWLMVAKPG